MHTSFVTFCTAALLLLNGAATSFGGKFNKVLSVGDAAPVWRDLPGVDGKRHSLAHLKEAKAIVVVFTSTECPVAAGYEDRLIALAKAYQKKGLAVVAINVNQRAADTLERMKQRARERGFNFPYLHDASQEIGRKYGAICTPQVFLLDRDRKIAYMGAFDDHNDPASVKKHYLRNAVEAVLNGKRPETTESRPRGCPIEYEERGKGQGARGKGQGVFCGSLLKHASWPTPPGRLRST